MMTMYTSKTAQTPDTKERGITLVETLMVLGIATAFIAGSLALYNQATNASRQRDAVSAVYGVIGQIRSQYATAAHYGDLTVGTPTGAPANPFGVALTVGPAGTGPQVTASTEPLFFVELSTVPQASCDALLTTFSSDTDGVVAHAAADATAIAAVATPAGVTAVNSGACIAENSMRFYTK